MYMVPSPSSMPHNFALSKLRGIIAPGGTSEGHLQLDYLYERKIFLSLLFKLSLSSALDATAQAIIRAVQVKVRLLVLT